MRLFVQLRHDDASHEAVTLCGRSSNHFSRSGPLALKTWVDIHFHRDEQSWGLQCENRRFTEGIQNGSWKEGSEAVVGGCWPSTDGRGKQGKQGGLTHKNREDSFTKPGGVMEDFLKNSS